MITQKMKIARVVVFNKDELYFRKVKVAVAQKDHRKALEVFDNVEESEEIAELEDAEEI